MALGICQHDKVHLISFEFFCLSFSDPSQSSVMLIHLKSFKYALTANSSLGNRLLSYTWLAQSRPNKKVKLNHTRKLLTRTPVTVATAANTQPVEIEAATKLQALEPQALIYGLYLHTGTVRGCPCVL